MRKKGDVVNLSFGRNLGNMVVWPTIVSGWKREGSDPIYYGSFRLNPLDHDRVYLVL